MSVRERVVQTAGFASLVSEAFVALVVASDRLTQSNDAVCARHRITGDQYNVLRILRGAHPTGHPRCEVARRLMRVAPDVTRMLDRLARGGFVKRGRSSLDRRFSVARITTKGLRLLETMQPEVDAAVASAMGPLSDVQLRQLAALCDALVP